MNGFTGAFRIPGGVGLRLARPGDENFLFQLFVEVRPWLSWAEGSDDFLRALYEQQYRAMQAGKDATYPEHLDLLIERVGEPVGRVVVNLGHSDWRIAELQIAAAARRAGIGSKVVRGLQMAAARAGTSLSLAAPLFGAHSYALYRRLGFQISTTDGALHHMVWRPADAHAGTG